MRHTPAPHPLVIVVLKVNVVLVPSARLVVLVLKGPLVVLTERAGLRASRQQGRLSAVSECSSERAGSNGQVGRQANSTATTRWCCSAMPLC